MTESEWLAEFVDAAQRELREAALEDTVEFYVAADPDRAMRVAFALLALGRVEEAREWFAERAVEQAEHAASTKETKLDDAAETGEQLDVGRLRWDKFHEAAVIASAAGDEQIQHDVGDVLFEHGTDPVLDGLGGRDERPRPFYVAAFGAVLCGRDDVGEYCEETRDRVQHKGYGRGTFYRLLVDAIDAIAAADANAATDAIDRYLQDYHAERVDGNDEGFHAVEQRLSREATALIALARTRGVDVRVESGYVPDAIYDDDHYPLGGH